MKHTALPIVTVAATAALLFTGCSSDSSDSSTPKATSTASVAGCSILEKSTAVVTPAVASAVAKLETDPATASADITKVADQLAADSDSASDEAVKSTLSDQANTLTNLSATISGMKPNSDTTAVAKEAVKAATSFVTAYATICPK